MYILACRVRVHSRVKFRLRTTFNPGLLAWEHKILLCIDEETGPNTITGDVWTFTTTSGLATSPTPGNGATIGTSAPIILQWQTALSANDNLYFGTDANAVNNATDPNQVPGQGQVTATQFYVSNLDPNMTYYWRVDTVYPPWSPIKGNVWSFNTGAIFVPPGNGVADILHLCAICSSLAGNRLQYAGLV